MTTAPINPFVNCKDKDGGKTPSFDAVYKGYFMELLDKIIPMFSFTGLPETVNERYFKAALILTGNCALWKTKGNWYAVKGTRGAQPNEYYIGTEYIIANPILGSANVKWTDKDIQVFYWNSLDELFANTMENSGFYFLIDRTARILAEIYRSTITALKNSRLTNVFSALNNNEKESINKIITDMRNCEDSFTSIQDFRSKMTVNPALQDTPIKDLLQEFVELEQFWLAQFYHAIGVNSNYNLKRAQINNEEIMTNAYILVVSLADLLPTLQRCCEEFSAKSGITLTVDFSEDWKKMREMEMHTPEDDNEDEDSPNSDEDNTEEGDDNESEKSET